MMVRFFLVALLMTLTALPLYGQTAKKPDTAKAPAQVETKSEVSQGTSVGAADKKSDLAKKVEFDKIKSLSPLFVSAFEKADVDGLMKLFSTECEMVTEVGTLYYGPNEIRELFTTFFGDYPGAKLTIEVESIRSLGSSLAIEEGVRTILVPMNEEASARVRYHALYTLVGKEWKLASLRDFPEMSPVVAGQTMKPLEWLVGDWINEEGDSKVTIQYRWSDDKNFILGEFSVEADGQTRKTSQRIGWDPANNGFRSWTFDADGGFSEGHWAMASDGWLIKSHATLPSGQTGTATIRFAPLSKDRFMMRGYDRVISGAIDDDFDLIAVRKLRAAKP